MTIIASADGSALGNPGPAGWAWYIDPTSWRAGGWAHGTNNMGELTAVLNLLEETRHRADEPLTVYCDSQYVINSITKWMPGWKKKGWKKRDGKPVMNVDIMKALDRELTGRRVSFEWVKGHAGHELNEAADQRARAVATAYQAGTAPQDMPTGPGFRDRADATHTPGPAEEPFTSAQARPGGGAGGGGGHGRGSGGDREPSGAGDRVEPDLFSELAELDHSAPAAVPAPPAEGAAPGAGSVPAHLVAEALDRETALLTHRPGSSREDRLHPGMLWVDAHGRTGTAADFERRAGTGGGVPEELRVSALGAGGYHVSYRVQEPSAVTRRSSVWVREDQHNEMGPWLLRHHQVTAED
ncbi:ribonuclease H [Kocuria sp.]|uniref:ribonuclease H family protein n=1 Tax=Kocuria sp. TaxID=1871328 RepID=UPI0026DC5D64|nr:ribonuclease H [Kocuria sp.]MDO4919293.1 ribonuclease H [Kocuria sp.]